MYSCLIECSSGVVLLLEALSIRAFSHFFLSFHCFQMLSWHCNKRRHDILATAVSSDLQQQKNGNSLDLQSDFFFFSFFLFTRLACHCHHFSDIYFYRYVV